MCHSQGAGLYLLSYMPIWVLVDKIMCSMWLCVYYVAAWCVSICRPLHSIHTITQYTELYQPKLKLACNSEVTDELPDDGTQLPKHAGTAM
jgi:hypothetical protein